MKQKFEDIQYQRACNLAAASKNTEKSDEYRIKAFRLYLKMEKIIFNIIKIINKSIPEYSE